MAYGAVLANGAHLVYGVRPAFASAEVSDNGTKVTVDFTEGVALSAMLQVLGDLVDIPQRDFLRAVVTLTVDGEEMIASDASLSGSSFILGLPS